MLKLVLYKKRRKLTDKVAFKRMPSRLHQQSHNSRTELERLRHSRQSKRACPRRASLHKRRRNRKEEEIQRDNLLWSSCLQTLLGTPGDKL